MRMFFINYFIVIDILYFILFVNRSLYEKEDLQNHLFEKWIHGSFRPAPVSLRPGPKSSRASSTMNRPIKTMVRSSVTSSRLSGRYSPDHSLLQYCMYVHDHIVLSTYDV